MKIILGIGNVGDIYTDTRHNSGFQALDLFASDFNIEIKKKDFKSMVGKGKAFGEDVLLMKPLTYVNLSGDALIMAKNFYKVDVSDIIILVDDMDTEPGHIRLKLKGSAGGHNGLKSIISQLGTDEFKRIRIGTGFDHGNVPLYNVVLSKVKGENKTLVDASTDFVANELLSFLKDGDFDKLMRNVNGFKPE